MDTKRNTLTDESLLELKNKSVQQIINENLDDEGNIDAMWYSIPVAVKYFIENPEELAKINNSFDFYKYDTKIANHFGIDEVVIETPEREALCGVFNTEYLGDK